MDKQQIVEEIVAQDGPRAHGFNYGVGWGKDTPLPFEYFEAAKLNTALRGVIHALTAKQWALETAMRNVRLAEGPAEKKAVVTALANAYVDTVESPYVRLNIAGSWVLGEQPNDAMMSVVVG